MPSIDEELSQIERDIRSLKIEYEQFFGGGRPRPPADTQWRVDTLIRRYNERTGELSFAQRFRFNNLAQTYAKYVDMWRKKTVKKETGITEHHFGAAAKAIEADRARMAALRPQLNKPAAAASVGHVEAHGNGAEHAQNAAQHAAVHADTHAIAEAAEHVIAARKAAAAFAMSFSDPEGENDKVKVLYHKLIEARTETGEKAGAPSLKDFERFVRQKTKDLKDKGGHEVEYTVNIENGRVKLKARISS
jgi:hypothetical protein